jgi:hypothetical protein
MESCGLLCFAPGMILVAAVATRAPIGPSPEQRAVAFLAVEVPQWSARNHCYSCHNNGDAARALYTAHRLGFEVPAEAMADTTDWLVRPKGWDENGGDERFNDKALARVQFAAALRTAVETGAVEQREPLVTAAELLLPYQRRDGSWQIGAQGTIGSPATCGPYLATYQARRTLQRADAQRFAGAIADAERWFRQQSPKTVLASAATLLALEGCDDPRARVQRRRCLDVIRRGEAAQGGWGPYVHSAPEPFDSAVVLLALSELHDVPDVEAMLRRGRGYLVASQLPDGSWLETTRPAGAESYAQRISTTGWAALALLATRKIRAPAEIPAR